MNDDILFYRFWQWHFEHRSADLDESLRQKSLHKRDELLESVGGAHLLAASSGMDRHSVVRALRSRGCSPESAIKLRLLIGSAASSGAAVPLGTAFVGASAKMEGATARI